MYHTRKIIKVGIAELESKLTTFTVPSKRCASKNSTHKKSNMSFHSARWGPSSEQEPDKAVSCELYGAALTVWKRDGTSVPGFCGSI
jgi:hypothetical protein